MNNNYMVGAKFTGEALKVLLAYAGKSHDELRTEQMEATIITGLAGAVRSFLNPSLSPQDAVDQVSRIYRFVQAGSQKAHNKALFFRLNHLLDEIVYPILLANVGEVIPPETTVTQSPAPQPVAPTPQPIPPLSVVPQPVATPPAFPGSTPGGNDQEDQ